MFEFQPEYLASHYGILRKSLHDAPDPHVAPGKLHNHIADGQLKFRLKQCSLLCQKGVHKGSGACVLFQRYTRKGLQLLVLQLAPFQFPEAAARYENIAYGLDLKLSDSPSAGKGGGHDSKINSALFQAFDGFRGGRIGNIHLNLGIFPVELFQIRKKIKLQRHIAGSNPHFPHIHIQHPLQHLPAFQQLLHSRLYIVV